MLREDEKSPRQNQKAHMRSEPVFTRVIKQNKPAIINTATIRSNITMRISIIIAVYKDIESLNLIINALRKQNYPDLEVVIAEDNDSVEMAEYVKSIKGLNVVHTTQEDLGIRKARSQNNAILKSSGDYLIFIDGDCIPYSSFINAHSSQAEPGFVLSGRRVNLGPGISKKIRNKTIDPHTIEKNFIFNSLSLILDKSSHTTQGIYISPTSWLYKNTVAKRKKSNLNILGCNFSSYKSDLLAIDGFDESYGETAVPDDTDLQWRLEAAGLKLKTCKMAANQFHLDHSRAHQQQDATSMVKKMFMRKEIGNYIAEIGLSSHSNYSQLTTLKNTENTGGDRKADFDVAIILINYNSSQYTVDCIRSIEKTVSDNISYGIVIIDNASEINDYNNLTNSISRADKHIQFYRSKINLGFSAGNMLGIQNIDAEYYFLLNNDCVLQNDCIGILHRFCKKNPQVALCSPQLINTDGEPQPCINHFPSLKTKIFGSGILNLLHGEKYAGRKNTYKSPVQVDVVSGSQMFIRAKHLFEIGGLDMIFFLYCEEEDLAIRLFNAGYKTYLVPQAKNFHAGSASTIKSLAIKKEFYISFLYFYKKHYGYINTFLIKIILSLKLIRKSLIDRDNFKLAIFVAKGAHIKHSLRHLQKVVPYNNKKHEKMKIKNGSDRPST